MFKTLLTIITFFIVCSVANSESTGLNNWTQSLSNCGRIYTIVLDPTNQNIIYAAGLDSGIYKSTNAGLNWTKINNGFTYAKIQCLAICNSNTNVLYAGTDQNGSTNSGVYVSTDGGASWNLRSTGISDILGVQVIIAHPTNPAVAFAGVFDGVNASTIGLYKTTNYGVNWVAANTGMNNKNILSIAFNPLNPNTIYAGTSLILPGSYGPSKIYKSYNGGTTWDSISNGLPAGTATGNPVRALSISNLDTSFVAASLFVNDTTGGVYISTNGGNLWAKKWGGLPNTATTLFRNILIKPGSKTEIFLAVDQSSATTPRGVYRTTDGGNSWTDFSGGLMLNTYSVRGLAYKTTGNPTLYAGGAAATISAGTGVFEYSWQGAVQNFALLLPTPGVNTNYVQIPYNTGMVGWGNNITIEAWVKIGGTATANTILNKGAASFDYQLGINVTSAVPFFRAGSVVSSATFAVTPNVWTHIAVTYDGTNVKFYNNGSLASTVPATTTLGTSTNEMRIGRGNSDPGSGYLDEIRLWSVVRTQAEITNNMCNKWIPNNATGLKAKWHFDNDYIDSVSGWNGTAIGTCSFDTTGIYCTPTGIVGNDGKLPIEYNLKQNYPNPFNPTTNISYQIPKSAFVTLKVFDILGKEVASLVNDNKQAGKYIVEFNASSLSSGVYFYKLQANEFVDVKRMILIK